MEERKKRLEERKRQRKEDRRNTFYRQKEEEAQRIHEEQLKKGNWYLFTHVCDKPTNQDKVGAGFHMQQKTDFCISKQNGGYCVKLALVIKLFSCKVVTQQYISICLHDFACKWSWTWWKQMEH